MDKPTKTGYYWFRGKFSAHYFGLMGSGPVEDWSGVVLCVVDEPDQSSYSGPKGFVMTAPEPLRLESFEGEWFELTEEKICGSSN